ncbi:MAG: protein kinase [Planctomycetes bacterium]|nr:protein kinase [Planctomycetota bacterium]
MARKRPEAKEIFVEALEREDGRARLAYLNEACGDDPCLRVIVEGLLAAYTKAGDFLQIPPFASSALAAESPLTEGPGTVIGRYELLEKIGEGGMAVVYMAEQEDPIHRKVALKIIKLGMDTRSVIARFEAERQALALMDHPSIAKVLDAGATETGRPYFVMELVQGVSITEYCDRNSLSTKDRLALFIQVCHAVQHAHQKGIIHRDIKPSNVMVTQHDGQPVPKVIDFGIAKATNQRLTEKTLFTRYAHIIGTPAYMSPEQAELSDLDIDTRSDIYSLGVLLYELLTGTTPFSEEELRQAGYVEMQRVIREQEPAKPSTRLGTLGETLTDIARHRSSTPDLLRKSLCGDLDWIVMKALEKARERRYETATALALDVQRHLGHEPVHAAAPSLSYRLGKFARRHRALVAGVLAVLTVFVTGFVVSMVLYVEASRSHRQESAARAEADRLRLQEAAQRQTAEAERDKARNAESLAEQRRQEAVAARDEAEQQAKISDAIATFLKSASRLDLPASEVSGADLEHLAGSRSLRSLSVPDAPVKDADLVSLKDVVSLEGLFLARTQITDAGLPNLKNLTALRVLCVEGTRVGDAGLAFLKDLHALEYLCLADTQVSDAGLVHLQGLASLRDLRLIGTRVTETGIAALRPHLSNCRIFGPDTSTVYDSAPVLVNGPFPERSRLVAAGWKASWSPDGNRLVFSSRGRNGLQILDIPSGRTTELTSSGKDPAWSPDGRFIAYVQGPETSDEETWVVKSNGETPRRLLDGGFPNWSADGRTLYAHSRKENKIFALAIEEPNAEPQVFYDRPISWYPAISPDGKRIAFGGKDALIIVDRQSGEPLLTWPTPGHRGLLPAWSPDGRLVAFGGFVSEPFGVWVLKVASAEAVQVADGPFTMPAWSADGKKLAADLRWEDTREIWMIPTAKLQGRKVTADQTVDWMPSVPPAIGERSPGPATRLVAAGWKPAWSPDGKRLAFSKPGDQGLQILDLQSNQITDLTSSGKDAAWSPDGRHIAYEDRPEPQAPPEIWLVEATGGSPRKFMNGLYPGWSADSKTLYVRSHTADRILAAALDQPDAEPQVFLDGPGTLYPAISADGTRAALGRQNGLAIVDCRTARVVLSWPTPGRRGLAVAWSPDGRHVAFGGFDNDPLGLWILDTEAATAVQVAAGRYTGPAWSPDGTKLAFDLRAQDVREVWMVRTADIRGPRMAAGEADRLRVPPAPRVAPPGRADTTSMERPLPGAPAPAFTLADLNGNRVSLSDFRGKVVLLSFWATWCQHCVAALPYLEALHEEYAPAGLVVLGLNSEPDRTKVKEFAPGWVSYVVLPGAERLFAEYHVKTIPRLIYIDREGTVRYETSGYSAGQEKEIETRVRELLGLQPGSPAGEQLASEGGRALRPSPADGAELGATRTTTLQWTMTPAAAACRVYFGPDPQHLVLWTEVRGANRIDSPALEKRRWYCWRVDTVQSDGSVVTGNVWSFSTGDLVGWWPFDEMQGRAAADASGRGHHGVLLGGPQWQPGRFGGALAFDGRDDYVSIKDAPDLDITGEITVACWVQAVNLEIPWQAIVAKGNQAWRVIRSVNNRSAQFACTGIHVPNTIWGNVDGQAVIDDGQWHHVAGIYDGARLRLYVDGTLDVSTEATGAVNATRDHVLIGANARDEWRCWRGLIDEVRVYSYALTEDEIRELAVGRGPAPLARPAWLNKK